MVITAFFGALTLLGCQKLESTVRINSPIVSILVHLLLLTIGVFIFKSTDFCCIIASFLFKTGFIKSSAHHKDLSLDYIDYTILVLQTVSHILYYLYIELKSKHQNKGGCPHSRHSTEALLAVDFEVRSLSFFRDAISISIIQARGRLRLCRLKLFSNHIARPTA